MPLALSCPCSLGPCRRRGAVPPSPGNRRAGALCPGRAAGPGRPCRCCGTLGRAGRRVAGRRLPAALPARSSSPLRSFPPRFLYRYFALLRRTAAASHSKGRWGKTPVDQKEKKYQTQPAKPKPPQRERPSSVKRGASPP